VQGRARAEVALAKRKRQDFAAHERAITLVEVQHPRQLGVTTVPNVRVNERGCQVRSTEVLEVHREKCHSGGHIGTAEAGVELDAIKQVQPPARAADAAGVEVSVPVANVAPQYACPQQFGVIGQELVNVGADRFQ